MKLSDGNPGCAFFAKVYAHPNDQITFALSNTYPDCVIRCRDGRKRDVEVTMAQAIKRLYLARELNERGTGRGFINVAEDASSRDFKDAMEEMPKAYSTTEVIDCIQHDINLRAQKKRWHQGDTMLVEADLLFLPLADGKNSDLHSLRK